MRCSMVFVLLSHWRGDTIGIRLAGQETWCYLPPDQSTATRTGQSLVLKDSYFCLSVGCWLFYLHPLFSHRGGYQEPCNRGHSAIYKEKAPRSVNNDSISIYKTGWHYTAHTRTHTRHPHTHTSLCLCVNEWLISNQAGENFALQVVQNNRTRSRLTTIRSSDSQHQTAPECYVKHSDKFQPQVNKLNNLFPVVSPNKMCVHIHKF